MNPLIILKKITTVYSSMCSNLISRVYVLYCDPVIKCKTFKSDLFIMLFDFSFFRSVKIIIFYLPLSTYLLKHSFLYNQFHLLCVLQTFFVIFILVRVGFHFAFPYFELDEIQLQIVWSHRFYMGKSKMPINYIFQLITVTFLFRFIFIFFFCKRILYHRLSLISFRNFLSLP